MPCIALASSNACLRRFPAVQQLDLTECSRSDAQAGTCDTSTLLKDAACFSQLRSLTLTKSLALLDVHLQHLAHCTRLTAVDLRGCSKVGQAAGSPGNPSMRRAAWHCAMHARKPAMHERPHACMLRS